MHTAGRGEELQGLDEGAGSGQAGPAMSGQAGGSQSPELQHDVMQEAGGHTRA